MRVLSPDSCRYPELLRQSKTPPPLVVKGRCTLSRLFCMSGGEGWDALSYETAYRYARAMGSKGWRVVTTGRPGVDTAALKGCRDSGLTPVVVLPCSFDRYRGLFFRRCCYLSCFEKGVGISRSSLLTRQSVMAAMSSFTIITSLSYGSSSWITAREALDASRDVALLFPAVREDGARLLGEGIPVVLGNRSVVGWGYGASSAVSSLSDPCKRV